MLIYYKLLDVVTNAIISKHISKGEVFFIYLI